MFIFSRTEYERFLYSLTEQYPDILRSTLQLYTNSAKTALIRGTIYFKNNLELRVFEYVDMTDGEIFDYRLLNAREVNGRVAGPQYGKPGQPLAARTASVYTNLKHLLT